MTTSSSIKGSFSYPQTGHERGLPPAALRKPINLEHAPQAGNPGRNERSSTSMNGEYELHGDSTIVPSSSSGPEGVLHNRIPHRGTLSHDVRVRALRRPHPP